MFPWQHHSGIGSSEACGGLLKEYMKGASSQLTETLTYTQGLRLGHTCIRRSVDVCLVGLFVLSTFHCLHWHRATSRSLLRGRLSCANDIPVSNAMGTFKIQIWESMRVHFNTIRHFQSDSCLAIQGEWHPRVACLKASKDVP